MYIPYMEVADLEAESQFNRDYQVFTEAASECAGLSRGSRAPDCWILHLKSKRPGNNVIEVGNGDHFPCQIGQYQVEGNLRSE